MKSRWTLHQQVRVDSIGLVIQAMLREGQNAFVLRGSVAVALWTTKSRCPNDLDVFSVAPVDRLIHQLSSNTQITVVNQRLIKSSSPSLPLGATRAQIEVKDINGFSQDSFVCDFTPFVVTDIEQIICHNSLLSSNNEFEALSIGPAGMAAEKIVAYIDDMKRDVSLRWQDLFDLAILATCVEFKLDELFAQTQLIATARSLELPNALPEPFPWWGKAWSKTLWPDNKFEDFSSTLEKVRLFVNPIFSTTNRKGVNWNPSKWTWS